MVKQILATGFMVISAGAFSSESVSVGQIGTGPAISTAQSDAGAVSAGLGRLPEKECVNNIGAEIATDKLVHDLAVGVGLTSK